VRVMQPDTSRYSEGLLPSTRVATLTAGPDIFGIVRTSLTISEITELGSGSQNWGAVVLIYDGTGSSVSR